MGKKVLEGIFWEICCIQIEIYTQTSIEPKYGAFYFNYKVRVHTLGLKFFISSTELKSSAPFSLQKRVKSFQN